MCVCVCVEAEAQKQICPQWERASAAKIESAAADGKHYSGHVCLGDAQAARAALYGAACGVTCQQDSALHVHRAIWDSTFERKQNAANALASACRCNTFHVTCAVVRPSFRQTQRLGPRKLTIQTPDHSVCARPCIDVDERAFQLFVVPGNRTELANCKPKL